MPEVNEQTASITETKRIVSYGRFLKGFEEKEGVNVKGLRSKKFEAFYKDKVESTLGSLREEFAPWLEKQKEEFSSYFESSTDWSDIENSFMRGLKRSFVKQSRLYAEIDAEEDMLRLYSDSKTQKDAILAFAFDFTRSIRVSRAQGVEPQMALEIAEHSYDYNPDALIKFSQKFPDLPLSVFTYALTDYPHNPESFLSNVQKVVIEMKNKFPDLPQYMYVHVAMYNNKNADMVLNKKSKEFFTLTKEFPEFSTYQLQGIIMQSNPRERLVQARRILNAIEGEFADLPKSFFSMSVFKENAREYLLKVRDDLSKLKDDFSEFPDTEIALAYASRGERTSDFLEAVERKTANCKKTYPGMTSSFIRLMLVKSRGNIAVLKMIDLKAQELRDIYPDLSTAIIYESTQHKDPEKWLEDYKKRYRSKSLAA